MLLRLWNLEPANERTPLPWSLSPSDGERETRQFNGSMLLCFESSGSPHVGCYSTKSALRVEAFTDSFRQGDVRVRFLEELGMTLSNEARVELFHAVAAGKNDL